MAKEIVGAYKNLDEEFTNVSVLTLEEAKLVVSHLMTYGNPTSFAITADTEDAAQGYVFLWMSATTRERLRGRMAELRKVLSP